MGSEATLTDGWAVWGERGGSVPVDSGGGVVSVAVDEPVLAVVDDADADELAPVVRLPVAAVELCASDPQAGSIASARTDRQMSAILGM
jgi:hypothetical protein